MVDSFQLEPTATRCAKHKLMTHNAPVQAQLSLNPAVTQDKSFLLRLWMDLEARKHLCMAAVLLGKPSEKRKDICY